MKYFTLLVVLLLIIVNIVAGYIITAYDTPKVVSSSIVIVLNAILIYALQSMNLKDAFSISLSILFSLFMIVEFCVSLYIPATWTDNYAFIVLLSMFALQILMLGAVKINSDNVQ